MGIEHPNSRRRPWVCRVDGVFPWCLNASFPWTISSHKGPPFNESYVYADAEATLAALAGVGFGMQALSIQDGQTLAAGLYPTSTDDWVANFQKYPNVPVHHLQLATPGNGTWWSGYPISTVTVASGTAVLTCSGTGVNCSPFWGTGGPNNNIFIVGSVNPSLNTGWPGTCTCSNCKTCTDVAHIQFSAPHIADGTYNNGSVFSTNFWPVTMPFAVQHGATSTELWECDIDYAYNQTTFQPGNGGCNPQSVGGGLMGPGPSYEGAVSNTKIGQPIGTAVHGGKTTGSITQF